jgi:hypothetical protein
MKQFVFRNKYLMSLTVLLALALAGGAGWKWV